jgi:hypothetical protein
MRLISSTSRSIRRGQGWNARTQVLSASCENGDDDVMGNKPFAATIRESIELGPVAGLQHVGMPVPHPDWVTVIDSKLLMKLGRRPTACR